MKQVIMFGASEGSILIRYTLPRDYEVIAICDNNEKLNGTIIEGIPVSLPSKIKELSYDFIIITNVHGEEIKNQLQNLGVEKEKIIDYFKGKMFDNRLGTMRMLAEQIKSKKLPGDVAELGVYKGEFSYYINKEFKEKDCYLFDTFEGFDLRDCEFDEENNFYKAETNEFADTDINLILEKMDYPEKIRIRKGFFPETSIGLKDIMYCFVSLDADLYKPIYAGLKYFYPRLVKGGYIMVHDYNSVRYKGTKQAVDKYCEENGIYLVPLIDNCGSVVIGK